MEQVVVTEVLRELYPVPKTFDVLVAHPAGLEVLVLRLLSLLLESPSLVEGKRNHAQHCHVVDVVPGNRSVPRKLVEEFPQRVGKEEQRLVGDVPDIVVIHEECGDLDRPKSQDEMVPGEEPLDE